MRKYIDELGIKFEDTPQGWCENDVREEVWSKQRNIYGFDAKETWALDYTLKILIYERLCMYNELNIVDTSYYKFKYKESELTFQECIDSMIEGLKLDLTLEEFDKQRQNEDVKSKIDDVFNILALCINYLWW